MTVHGLMWRGWMREGWSEVVGGVGGMQIGEALPSEGKDWYLVLRDGWAAAVGAFDVLAPLPLDEVFKGKKLWGVADGELFVEDFRTKILASLWGQWARYERAIVEIVVGEIKRPWKYNCVATGWFRHGARGDFAVLAEARTYKREEDIHSCRAFSVGCPAGGDESRRAQAAS